MWETLLELGVVATRQSLGAEKGNIVQNGAQMNYFPLLHSDDLPTPETLRAQGVHASASPPALFPYFASHFTCASIRVFKLVSRPFHPTPHSLGFTLYLSRPPPFPPLLLLLFKVGVAEPCSCRCAGGGERPNEGEARRPEVPRQHSEALSQSVHAPRDAAVERQDSSRGHAKERCTML